MPVKLLVSNVSDDDGAPSEYRFDEAPIAIGRANENDLTLPDRKRIVSSQHAEIRGNDAPYQLVDLGSKNFTYLNGERLRSDQPYEVQSGDVFNIGEFEVEFVTVKPAPEPSAAAPATPDATVFAADFSNPFDEPAAQLSSALRDIIASYEQEAPNRREDALQAAFDREALDAEVGHEAVARVFDVLGVKRAGPAPEAPGSPAAAEGPQQASSSQQVPSRQDPSPEDFPEDSFQEEPSSPAMPAPEAASPPAGVGGPSDARSEVLFGVLLDAVARLIRIPWQFRHEFIGQTIVQSSDSAALYEGDAEVLSNHLLRASLSDEEARERRERLQEAVERLLVHQMAMLDGYKASAQTGARQLLSQIDPAAEEKAVAEESTLYGMLPFLGKGTVVDRLKTTHEELQSEDWSVAERRIFRPAFIKAYLARMTASPEADTD